MQAFFLLILWYVCTINHFTFRFEENSDENTETVGDIVLVSDRAEIKGVLIHIMMIDLER